MLLVPRPDGAYLTGGQGGGWDGRDAPAAAAPRARLHQRLGEHRIVRFLRHPPIRQPDRPHHPGAGAPPAKRSSPAAVSQREGSAGGREGMGRASDMRAGLHGKGCDRVRLHGAGRCVKGWDVHDGI